MARKGNQQKDGVDRQASNHKKRSSDTGFRKPEKKGRGKASEVKVFPGDELINGNQSSSSLEESMSNTDFAGDETSIKHNSEKILRKAKQGMEGMQDLDQQTSSHCDTGNCNTNIEDPVLREENGTSPRRGQGKLHSDSNFECLLNALHIINAIEYLKFSDNVMIRSLRVSVLSILKAASDLLEQQRPSFKSVMTNILSTHDYVRKKIKGAYPDVLKWLMHFGSIILLFSIIWLDCTLRGADSFLRMGTTSFFSVIWFSILSVIMMVGIFKFLMVLVLAAFLGVFVGFTLAIFVIAVSGITFLWFYGSFWTTALVIGLGGLTFKLSDERLALFITTAYSVYCAWTYVGWLGLLLGLNLSFISSDVLIYFLKNNVNEHRQTNTQYQQTAGMQGQSGLFNDEHVHASSSETVPGLSSDRSAGISSTSGANSEITSEEEVIRLLNCTDHYSALGLSRYENVDASLLKREYRKKAMLVHPDKNMGNEKAVEAFKKLQNAYEVLLDSLKRKAYDDELRKEELLNIFRRFQSTSQKNGRRGFFPSGFAHPGTDGGEDLFGESRRIVCKKCNDFHVWLHTMKPKSQARWCQDCNEFHQAKDGDGWVEQSSQPYLFGLLQKVDAPVAYVCADSKIYDATEWYICQGIRCPANTHKPSFHVNTSATFKNSTGKGTSSGQRGSQMPASNLEESMTEEEFFAWLQNAVQSGVFENFGGSTSTESSPSAKTGNANKSSSSNSGSANKRKKKGKKPW